MTTQSPRDVAERPEVRALATAAGTLLNEAEAFRIKSASDYEHAAAQLKLIKGRQKELTALRETITKPMRTALQAARALFSKPEDALARAEQHLKAAMAAFDAEQERQRREQQRKLDEAADRERRKLEQRAERAATIGNTDKAADLQQRAAMVVAPIVEQPLPAVAGIARRENWRAEVTDLRALVCAVANGSVPLTAVAANQPFLNGQARALRRELRYPGVRVVNEQKIAAGSV